ncbi:uncharacterized mitochondrial protein AtMg00810-like [Vigna angularis]|uniref:uncharacterized mitochondrial protein AtMg00810-like n=1 Tax=Phaseolus angularis TaxID=3914 RepID=UPI0022B2C2DF|nr:uncharacterized mitochondrial protein AtMg00810-like [Vigna angularis]
MKTLLNAKFKIKDLGQLKYFLGLEIARSQQGINLSQRKYALELLKDAGLLGCQPISTPIQPGTKFSKTEGKLYSDVHAYRRLLGRLLYLTNTRPDLCFAVSTLSQFLSNPLEEHYVVAIRILRYIKNNSGQGLFFPYNTEHALMAFSDSDWAACPDTRRYVTSFNVFYGASLISWKSKKQGEAIGGPIGEATSE